MYASSPQSASKRQLTLFACRLQDGFTHLTAEPSLLLDVANHFYKHTRGDWLLLVLEASKLQSQVLHKATFKAAAAPAGMYLC